MSTKRYLISGRIPGDDDDTVAELHIGPADCPVTTFIEKMLYKGEIADDWQSRPPTRRENRYGEWAYVTQLIAME